MYFRKRCHHGWRGKHTANWSRWELNSRTPYRPGTEPGSLRMAGQHSCPAKDALTPTLWNLSYTFGALHLSRSPLRSIYRCLPSRSEKGVVPVAIFLREHASMLGRWNFPSPPLFHWTRSIFRKYGSYLSRWKGWDLTVLRSFFCRNRASSLLLQDIPPLPPLWCNFFLWQFYNFCLLILHWGWLPHDIKGCTFRNVASMADKENALDIDLVENLIIVLLTTPGSNQSPSECQPSTLYPS